MIKAEDFVDFAKRNKPFESGLAETVAYLGWLDLFLASYSKMQSDEDSEENFAGEIEKAARILATRQEASDDVMYQVDEGVGIYTIASRQNLSGYTFFCLLLALAPHMDEKYAFMYRELRGDGRNHEAATFALAESLYSIYADENEMISARKSIGQISSCVYFDVFRDNVNSQLLYRFDVNPQLVTAVKGDYSLSKEIQNVAREVLPGQSYKEMVTGEELLSSLKSYIDADAALLHDEDDKNLIHISGAKGSGRKFLVEKVFDDTPVLFVDFMSLLNSGDDMSSIIGEIITRCIIYDEIPVISDVRSSEPEVRDGQENGKNYFGALLEVLDVFFGEMNRVIITSGKPKNMDKLAGKYRYFHVNVPEKRMSERRKLWHHFGLAYSFEKDVDLVNYAEKYNITAGIIEKALEMAYSSCLYEGREYISNDDIREALSSFNSSKLSELATKINQRYTWDDIEIDESQKKIMRLACDRAALKGKVDEEWGFEGKFAYGKGMSVLLYGPPGTGKTMAAQIMARDIGMDLYRVDLSQMVDKYVGETEKNLNRIFDVARDGNFILFFDEADALFSKRTEVKESNDKYANTQTAFLLQKIEEHDGITFLATNLYNNFDEAFVRRITYSVRLDKPDAATRLRLFKSVIPSGAPLDPQIDFKFFADRFELTGSNIKAIMYSAAYIAATQGEPIGTKHLVTAMKYEYAKLGKLLMASDLEQYTMYL